MSAQSDRIRAVLSRSESTRTSSEPATLPLPEKTGAATPAGLSTVASLVSPSTATKGPGAPAAEVERTLPLIAANDRVRASFAGSEALRMQAAESALMRERTLPPMESASGKRGRLAIAALAIGAVIAVGGVAAVLTMDHWRPSREPAPAADLQMHVEAQGKGLLTIRWNPKSSPVLEAREGRLITSEPGQPPRTVTLDIAQLKAGHVYYQSQAESLEFRLEVIDRSGSVTRESVMTLASSVPPVTSPAVVPPVPNSANLAPAFRQPAPAPELLRTTQPQEIAPANRPAVRQFTPPPVSQPSSEAKSAVVLDAPAAIPGAAAIASSPIGVPASVADIGVPPVNAAPPAKPVSAPTPVRAGGDLQPGALLKKVNPVYPSILQLSNVRGIVRFTGTIGKDGKIHDLQLVSGNKALVQSAIDAVKQWVYRPTMLNGEPVEVITQIEVNFNR
jgi:protein TonB